MLEHAGRTSVCLPYRTTLATLSFLILTLGIARSIHCCNSLLSNRNCWSWEPKPASSLIAQSEATRGDWAIEVACLTSPCTCGFQHRLVLLNYLVPLFDKLSRDDSEYLINSLAILCTDLMAAIPANVLSPETAAPLAVHARHTTVPTCANGRRR